MAASPIPVDLKDGAEHTLSYGYGAIRRMERDGFKRSIHLVLADLFATSMMSADDICIFLWGGLLHENRALTLEAVEQKLDDYMQTGAGTGIEFAGPIIEALIEGKWAVRVNRNGNSVGGEPKQPDPPRPEEGQAPQ